MSNVVDLEIVRRFLNILIFEILTIFKFVKFISLGIISIVLIILENNFGIGLIFRFINFEQAVIVYLYIYEKYF